MGSRHGYQDWWRFWQAQDLFGARPPHICEFKGANISAFFRLVVVLIPWYYTNSVLMDFTIGHLLGSFIFWFSKHLNHLFGKKTYFANNTFFWHRKGAHMDTTLFLWGPRMWPWHLVALSKSSKVELKAGHPSAASSGCKWKRTWALPRDWR